MTFENRFHEKSSFPKRVYPRKPLYSCSRIGVREGSLKKKDFKKRGKSEETPSNKLEKNMSEKGCKIIEKSLKNRQQKA